MKLLRTKILALLACCHVPAFAHSDWYHLKLTDAHLKPIEETTRQGAPLPLNKGLWNSLEHAPRVLLEGEGEAYGMVMGAVRWDTPWGGAAVTTLAVRAPEGSVVRGQVAISRWAEAGADRFQFELTPEQASSEHERAFHSVKWTHYQRRVNAGIPGGAWFRFQAAEARGALGLVEESTYHPPEDQLTTRRAQLGFDETLDLFSGRQALWETLALDQDFAANWHGERSIECLSLPGVRIPEYDWGERLEGVEPKLDELSSWIPVDQYALFFPTFADLLRTLDCMDEFAAPLFNALQPSAQAVDVQGRYTTQLCLEMSRWTRVLGTKLIEQVAITGGDPYLETGSDLALLFKCRDADALERWLAEAQRRATQSLGVEQLSGQHGTIQWSGARSADRRISVYMARVKDVVVLTNSEGLLGRVLEAHSGDRLALNTSPDYRSFRDRYALSDPEELAFLVMTDPAIRRLCGPKWRIGASRRMGAAALLADSVARNSAQQLGLSDSKPEFTAQAKTALKDLFWIPGRGPCSQEYGCLPFLTPIAELDLDLVTREERAAYERFRRRYEARWSGKFDPFALQLKRGPQAVSFDLSVFPLIGSTAYESFRSLAGIAAPATDAGRGHPEAALQLSLSVDPWNELLSQVDDFLGVGSVHDWFDNSIDLYVEDGSYWDSPPAGDPSNFLSKEAWRIPWVISFGSDDQDALCDFEKTLFEFLLGSTGWSQKHKEHRGETYLSLDIPFGFGQESPLLIAVVPGALLISFHEEPIHRAIQRSQEPPVNSPAEGMSGLGSSAVLRVGHASPVLAYAWQREGLPRHQASSWTALHILNEWRHRFPDEDPIEVHERLFGVRLQCPGGGAFELDEDWGTLRSENFGHPAAPRPGPRVPKWLANLMGAEFSLTFESDGLRARGSFDWP